MFLFRRVASGGKGTVNAPQIRQIYHKKMSFAEKDGFFPVCLVGFSNSENKSALEISERGSHPPLYFF